MEKKLIEKRLALQIRMARNKNQMLLQQQLLEYSYDFQFLDIFETITQLEISSNWSRVYENKNEIIIHKSKNLIPIISDLFPLDNTSNYVFSYHDYGRHPLVSIKISDWKNNFDKIFSIFKALNIYNSDNGSCMNIDYDIYNDKFEINYGLWGDGNFDIEIIQKYLDKFENTK